MGHACPSPADLLAHVERCLTSPGWAVTMVAARDDTPPPHDPPFVYTTGLWKTFGHPELLFLGLPTELAYRLLNDLGAKIAAGDTLTAGQPIPAQTLANVPFQVRAVTPPFAALGSPAVTRLLHPDEAVPHLQIVWPDATGSFPVGRGWPHQPLLPAAMGH